MAVLVRRHFIQYWKNHMLELKQKTTKNKLKGPKNKDIRLFLCGFEHNLSRTFNTLHNCLILDFPQLNQKCLLGNSIKDEYILF